MFQDKKVFIDGYECLVKLRYYYTENPICGSKTRDFSLSIECKELSLRKESKFMCDEDIMLEGHVKKAFITCKTKLSYDIYLRRNNKDMFSVWNDLILESLL